MVSSITVEKISRYILKDIFRVLYGNTYLLASLLLWNIKMPISEYNASNTNNRLISNFKNKENEWKQTKKTVNIQQAGNWTGNNNKRKVSEQQLAGWQDREHKHRLTESLKDE